MLCTIGEGAACVLLERAPGPGFLAMIHGTHAGLASGMTIREPFPPVSSDSHYVYEFSDTTATARFLHTAWRTVRDETLNAAGIARDELACAVFHQTHAEQVRALTSELGLGAERVPMVVDRFGNMGTPTIAVALARVHPMQRPGSRYLLQAVGGGISWCGIRGGARLMQGCVLCTGGRTGRQVPSKSIGQGGTRGSVASVRAGAAR